MASTNSGDHAVAMSVLNVPHMIALTRTLGAKVCVDGRVHEFSHELDGTRYLHWIAMQLH